MGEYLAVDRPVLTSNMRGGQREFGGWLALDNDDKTFWATDDTVTQARLELDTEGALDINGVLLGEAPGMTGRIQSYKVEGFVENAWKLLVEGTSIGDRKLHRFPTSTVWKVRLSILGASGGPAIRTFALYHTPGPQSASAARVE
jgi:alpha-L-fucosidase